MSLKKKKPNWPKIKLEYETTKTSYRKLAEKYKVSFNTLKDRAKREKWTEHRQEVTTEIAIVATQKVIERKSAQLDREIEVADLIIERTLEALKDHKQFNRHLVQKKEKEYKGDETQEVIEEIFEKFDTKSLREIAAAFTEAASFKKDLVGVMNTYNQQKIELERQKLQLEREKLELEKAKLAGPVEEIDVQQYVDALQGQVSDIWADDEQQSRDGPQKAGPGETDNVIQCE